MLHRTLLVVAAAVTRLRGLCPRRCRGRPSSFGFRKTRSGARRIRRPAAHGAGASDADEGCGLERWEAEFYCDPLDVPQARLVALGQRVMSLGSARRPFFATGSRNRPRGAGCSGSTTRASSCGTRRSTRERDAPPADVRDAPVDVHHRPRAGKHRAEAKTRVDGSPVFFPRRPRGADAASRRGGAASSLRRWTHDTHVHCGSSRVAHVPAHARHRDPARAPGGAAPAGRSRRSTAGSASAAPSENDVRPAARSRSPRRRAGNACSSRRSTGPRAIDSTTSSRRMPYPRRRRRPSATCLPYSPRARLSLAAPWPAVQRGGGPARFAARESLCRLGLVDETGNDGEIFTLPSSDETSKRRPCRHVLGDTQRHLRTRFRARADSCRPF